MENQKPFFSVITCTYNSSQFLPESIASLEKQVSQDYEHIFIDALSTDDTVNIIKTYQASRPERVRFYQHPPKGISNAMNHGINYSKGEVVLILHSDDYLHSAGVLEHVKRVFEERQPDVVVGDCIFTGDNGMQSIWPKGRFKRWLQKKFYKNFLFFFNNIPHPSTYMKKEVFTKYGGFREDLKNVMDLELWFRVFKKTKVLFIDEPLSVYRAHANTTSNLYSERAKAEIRKVMEEYKKEYRFQRLVNFLVFIPAKAVFKLFRLNWLSR